MHKGDNVKVTYSTYDKGAHKEGSEGLKLIGYVDVEVVGKDGVVKDRRRQHNTITNVGKQLLLARSAGALLSISNNLFGKMCASESLISPKVANGIYGGRVGVEDYCLHNVLLNMGSMFQGGNGELQFLNSFDSDFSGNMKVTGYASNDIRSSVANPKKGAQTKQRGEDVILGDTIAARWSYPAGIASGTFDTIAMMAGNCFSDLKADGIRIEKCLDAVNMQESDFVSQSTGFMPPGVEGYTANDEVLLNFNQGGNNKWRYNMTTGEVTAVTGEEKFAVMSPFYNQFYGTLTLGLNYIVKNGYLHYVSYGDGGGNPYLYIHSFNLATGTDNPVPVTQAYVPYAAGFLVVGENVYLAKATQIDSTPTYGMRLYQVNISSDAAWSGGSLVDVSTVLTLPAGMQGKPCVAVSVGSSYLIGIKNNYTDNLAFTGMLFNSIESIASENVIGCVCGLFGGSVIFSAGTNQGVLQVGTNKATNVASPFSAAYPYNDEYFIQGTINATGNYDGGATSLQLTRGVYLSMLSWSANVLSYVKLDQPVQKGDEDTLNVAYGYKIA